MQPEKSVHDNFVYAYSVNCEARCVTLHTSFRDRDPHEFTDVQFSDVVAHHFDHSLQQNILFDVEEIELATLVQTNAELLANSWRYGWPPVDYKGDLNSLITALTITGVRAYAINSSYGLSGWVLAKKYQLISRSEAALVG